jgi:hypothetical protein
MDSAKYEYLLDAIAEKKNVLFGKFSSCITHKDKENTWVEILNKCKAMGYNFVPETSKLPGWKYLRDTVWGGNLKTRTLVGFLRIRVLHEILKH